MAKHTQTIRWQFADELFDCVWPFFGIDAKRVNNICGKVKANLGLLSRVVLFVNFDQKKCK